uniref:Orf100d n=1 Tax=Batis maritima TaxID=4436 RepID=A0A068BD74_BATMA|nr:orf100d [Batis maritima]AIC83392.1 orf100d [Batis maritima]
MHIPRVPLLLRFSNAGTTQGLMLSRISSFRTNSITRRLSSSCSAGLILDAARLGSVELKIRSFWCWMPLIGGNPFGNSFCVMSRSPIRPGSGVGLGTKLQ